MDPSAAAPPQQRRRRRLPHSAAAAGILIFTICFEILSLLKLDSLTQTNLEQKHSSEIIDLPRVEEWSKKKKKLPTVQKRIQNNTQQLTFTSGVGLVTTDGQWDISPDHNHYDIKILGFADTNYASIAKVWYNRLTKLGYKEHYIGAYDKELYDDLISQNYRVLPCFIDNPDYERRTMGLFRQIMAYRLKLVREMVKNGTHVLLTDVDNVFSRHVDPVGFVEEGYDVYHAYEMRYPKKVYHDHGFVFCSGHLFFRSSEATLRFLDMAANRCGEKCDDQVMYNHLFWSLDIEWDGGDPPSHPGAMRVANHELDNGLLVESATGRSRVTNHTIKIWDRDFAWRLSGGIPEQCPSKNNWVGMPSINNNDGDVDKIQSKLALFDVWDDYCLSPEADEKRVKMACKTSIADCSLCKSPVCKTCWTDRYGQEMKERTCIIMDAHATEDPFHDKEEDLVELTDGSTVKFCGSNKWSGSGGVTCNARVQFMVSRHHISEQNAKISVLENVKDGCKCIVDG